MNLAQFAQNICEKMPYVSVKHDAENSTVIITDACGEIDYRIIIDDNSETQVKICKAGETDGTTYTLSHYASAKDLVGFPRYIHKMFELLAQIDDKVTIAEADSPSVSDCAHDIPF